MTTATGTGDPAGDVSPMNETCARIRGVRHEYEFDAPINMDVDVDDECSLYSEDEVPPPSPLPSASNEPVNVVEAEPEPEPPKTDQKTEEVKKKPKREKRICAKAKTSGIKKTKNSKKKKPTKSTKSNKKSTKLSKAIDKAIQSLETLTDDEMKDDDNLSNSSSDSNLSDLFEPKIVFFKKGGKKSSKQKKSKSPEKKVEPQGGLQLSEPEDEDETQKEDTIKDEQKEDDKIDKTFDGHKSFSEMSTPEIPMAGICQDEDNSILRNCNESEHVDNGEVKENLKKKSKIFKNDKGDSDSDNEDSKVIDELDEGGGLKLRTRLYPVGDPRSQDSDAILRCPLCPFVNLFLYLDLFYKHLGEHD